MDINRGGEILPLFSFVRRSDILHALRKHMDLDDKALDQASQKWLALLHAHEKRAYIAKERIERCAQGLQLRIQKLKAYNENLG